MRLLYALVRIPVKLTLEIAGRAVSVVGLRGDGTAQPQYAPPPPPPVPRSNGGAPPVAPEPEAVPAPAATPEPAPEQAPEPVHVSEEPELIVEVADRGAEDGAGAEVHVDEPWEGYDRMTAADIKDRLRTQDKTVAAAVSLYEASRKGRSSVLEAAARRTSARPSG